MTHNIDGLGKTGDRASVRLPDEYIAPCHKGQDFVEPIIKLSTFFLFFRGVLSIIDIPLCVHGQKTRTMRRWLKSKTHLVEAYPDVAAWAAFLGQLNVGEVDKGFANFNILLGALSRRL